MKWFNQHVKDAAIALLEAELTAVNLRPDQSASATKDRIEVLRKQIAVLKEIK